MSLKGQLNRYAVLLGISLLINNTLSANILCLMGMASASHHIWNKSIMVTLANRGHNLTILTVEEEISTNNMHFLYMEGVYEAFNEKFWKANDQVVFTRKNPISQIIEIYDFYFYIDTLLAKTNGIQELLNYPDTFHFDLVIHDFTSAQFLLGFVDKFQNPPLVSISPYSMPPYTYAVSEVPIFPSYIPHLNTKYTNKMGFYERILNSLTYLFDWFYRTLFYIRHSNRMAKQVFGPQLRNLQEIESRTDLVLINIDFSIDYPQLLPPNVIPVGGLQVKRVENLPENVRYFLENSSKPAIYFSLGTNMQSAYLSKDLKNSFMATFKKLPQYNFIWKYESDDLKELPENLMIIDWCPQVAILAHRNIKLFITHGGLLSLQESMWHGVPILGIPFFGDQYQNIRKALTNGIGDELDHENTNSDDIVRKVKNLIENQRYSKNMARISNLFKSQPLPPLDRAIFWIETTIYIGGLDHLKPHSSQMSFLATYMLDAYIAVSIIISLQSVIVIWHLYLKKRLHISSRRPEENKIKKRQ